MPKRKHTKYEDDLEHLMHKVRKLKRKIRNHSESISSHSDSQEDYVLQDTASPILRPDDWFPEYPDDELAHNPLAQDVDQIVSAEVHDNAHDQYNHSQPVEGLTSAQNVQTNTQAVTSNTNATEIASSSTAVPLADKKASEDAIIDLDEDILQILGDDPSTATKFGKNIRTEVATRFIHAVTNGINKEDRKELINKYLTPANCVCIGAPMLNPEIKAAISENFVKRDKGIESKQKEMASAISCLGEIITSQLNAKEKNNELLQKLIDLSRILCDLQYADSITRRNFILFTLKKDLKDHLVNTKIDASLFGENLTETLKTAKAMIKSGIEIKAAAPKQAPTQPRRLNSTVSRPLNRRGPAPRRPPPGPPPPAQAPRGRAPAPRAPPHPAPAPPTRYYNYRTSHAHQPPQRRF